MVERSAAGFAALAAGETELARLRDALEQMEDTSLTLTEFNATDTEFHVRVGEASKNRLVGQFMQALRDAVRRQAIEAIAGLGEWHETARGLRQDHLQIFEAIASGDPVAATAAVDAHIRRRKRNPAPDLKASRHRHRRGAGIAPHQVFGVQCLRSALRWS
jgi:GntR family transcriptional repressor for pyruvate dehydrogenase complex